MVDVYFTEPPEWALRCAPSAVMLAVIGAAGCESRRQAAIDAARRSGVRVAGPELFASELAWSALGGLLRAGIGQIAALRDAEIRAIDELRQSADPRSFPGALRTLRLRAKALAAMVRSGLLDCVGAGLSRPQLLWLLLRDAGPQEELFEPAAPPCLSSYSRERALADELRALGVLVSAHPVELVRRSAGARATAWGVSLVACDPVQWPARGRIGIVARILAFDRSRARERCFFEDDRGICAVDPGARAAEPLVRALDAGHELFLLAGRPRWDRGAGTITLELERLSVLDPGA